MSCVYILSTRVWSQKCRFTRKGTVRGCKLLLAIVAHGVVEFSSTKGHLGIGMKASFPPPDAQLLVNLLFFLIYINSPQQACIIAEIRFIPFTNLRKEPGFRLANRMWDYTQLLPIP